ncbi:hypothetical protein C0991_007136 [Blastosporella zonata]|nr:hypothetical protein C0991_007136 [Blastosporella zonata]
MSGSNLDDLNQSTGDDEDDEGGGIPFVRPIHHDYDLLDGERLRINAYTAAWRKCLDRIKSIVHALHAPMSAKVEQEVRLSYDNVLSGLPYPEIPVIGITDPTSSSAFLDQIATVTDSFDLDDEDVTHATAFTSHLYPTDCSNLTSALKTLIAGFVDRPHLLEKVKGRPTASLVNYDMEMLLAWYSAIREAHDITKLCRPKLVVLLHDFEQLDPLVVQDIFTISSLYIPRLPLIFILALSSPASPSFLHSTYPRSTLALLRVSTHTVPSGARVLEEVLLRTFFDMDFEPDLVIGPSILTYLTDYCGRHNPSLDAALNILHLAHLKHFSGEPLTLLIKSTPSSEILAQPASAPLVEAVLARLQSSPSTDSSNLEWPNQSLPPLIAAIDDTRAFAYSRARRVRIGFRLIKLIQDFMASQGYKGLNWGSDTRAIAIMDVMIAALQGGLGSDIKYLGIMVKKLRTAQLGALLNEMHFFFNSLPVDVRSREEEARTNLVLAINALPQQVDDDVTAATSQVAANFGDWLVKYLK